MKTLLTLFTSLILSANVHGQNWYGADYYSHSVTLEFHVFGSYVFNLVEDWKHELRNFKDDIGFPNFSLDFESQIGESSYFECGVMPFYSVEKGNVFIKNYGGVNLSAYTGFLWKWNIGGSWYFTPSIDVYGERFVQLFPGTTARLSSYSFSAGPTIGVEYFFSDRFSMNSDLFNINFGWQHYIYTSDSIINDKWERGLSGYKIVSLGLHYNF